MRSGGLTEEQIGSFVLLMENLLNILNSLSVTLSLDFAHQGKHVRQLLIDIKYKYAEDYSFANSISKPRKVSVNTILPSINPKLRGRTAIERLRHAIIAKAYILEQMEMLTPYYFVYECLKLYSRINNITIQLDTDKFTDTISFSDFSEFILYAWEHHTFEDIRADIYKDLTYKPKDKFVWDFNLHFKYSIDHGQRFNLRLLEVYSFWCINEYPSIYQTEVVEHPNTKLKPKAPSFRSFRAILADLGIHYQHKAEHAKKEAKIKQETAIVKQDKEEPKIVFERPKFSLGNPIVINETDNFKELAL